MRCVAFQSQSAADLLCRHPVCAIRCPRRCRVRGGGVNPVCLSGDASKASLPDSTRRVRVAAFRPLDCSWSCTSALRAFTVVKLGQSERARVLPTPQEGTLTCVEVAYRQLPAKPALVIDREYLRKRGLL